MIQGGVSAVGKSPLDQLGPVEGIPQDLPGQLVGLGQLLGGACVKEGQQVLHQLGGRPKLPLSRKLLNLPQCLTMTQKVLEVQT